MTRSVGAEKISETEGFKDGKIGLDLAKRSARALFSGFDDTASLIEGRIHTGNGVLRDGDITQVERFEKSSSRVDLTSVKTSLGGRHHLTSTAMDGISVHGKLGKRDLNTTESLFAEDTSARSLQEGTADGILDLIEVLNTLGGVNKKVGETIGRASKGPDFTGISDIPVVVVGQNTGALLGILSRFDITTNDGVDDLIGEGFSDQVDAVVLVGRLGDVGDLGLFSDGLTEVDHRVRNNNGGTLHEVVTKILDAHF